MSTKRKILLPTIVGIVASSLAGAVGTLDVPLENRYHEIGLTYIDGGGSPTDQLSMFGDIIVYKNGKPERTHSALQLDHLNGINGSQYQRQQVGTGANMRQTQTIFFAEPWRKSKQDTDVMAWNVTQADGWNSFQIKATLLANFPATGSIVAYARVDAVQTPPKNGTQTIKKVYRDQFPANGASNDLTTFAVGDAYQTMCFINPTGAYINYATVKSGGTLMFERVQQSDNIADLINLNMNPATSQAAGSFGYDIVFDADDPLLSALPTDNGTSKPWVKLEYSAAASGNVVCLSERLGPAD